MDSSSPVRPSRPASIAPDASGQELRKQATQQRLIEGMLDAAAALGYAEASVAEVLARSGASRTAFYARFTDRHACFMAALQDVSERLDLRVEATLSSAGEDVEPCISALGAIAAFASEEPAAAQVLFGESLAAGAASRAVRDELIERIAAGIEARWQRRGPDAPGLDVPAKLLVGAVFRLLALRLRVGVGGTLGLRQDLEIWANAYTLERGPFRWRSPAGIAAVEPRKVAEPATQEMPRQLPTGRHRLGAAEVAANQRERLLRGLALAAYRDGYAKISVTEIVAAAKLSREVFYAHFSEKSEAAIETLQLSFELAMATTIRAFFSAETWPERLWQAARAFVEHYRAHPEFSNLLFVEAYEIGPSVLPFLQQRREIVAMLMEEGYSLPGAGELPRSVSQALAAAVSELAYLQAPRGDGEPTPDLFAHSVYMCLAPFLGPRAAGELIEGHLGPVLANMPKPAETKDSEHARDELVAAAAQVFAKHGFQAATLDEIAGAAGWPPATIEQYFSGKDDLFFAVYEAEAASRVRAGVRYSERASEGEHAELEFPQGARAYADHFMARLARDPEFMVLSLEFLAHARRDPALQEAFADRFAWGRLATSRILEQRAQDAGLELPMAADELGTILRELGTGLSLAKLADPDAIPDQLYGDFVELLFKLIGERGQSTAQSLEADGEH
ncbi:MAG TPA: TetR/AcrR family transcriptional regulator [Solirubrobacteraceae bacterium]|nr:TetR/AcrR family transcriptional regulator [Solirubrobacteraceae bacterium]